MSLFDKMLAAFTLAALLLASHAATAQQLITTQDNDLKGHVKSVREYGAEFKPKGGKLVEGKRKLDSVETYDARGLRLTNYYYTDEGNILDGGENKYDASGRLTETLVKHDKYVYLPDRRVYAYDVRGNLIEEKSFDAQGRLLGRYVYEYDGRCRMTRSDSIAEGQNQVFKGHKRTTYTYDEGGRVIEYATFMVEGENVKPDDYRLGYQRFVVLYDAEGRRTVALRLTEEGKLYTTTVTSHDARGEIAEESEYDSEGGVKSRTAYSYEFDVRGNWVKQITSKWVTRDGKSFFEPDSVSYREITYYGDAEVRAAVGTNAPATGCGAEAVARVTDTEEYAVYSALVGDMFDASSVRLYVVSRFTSAAGTDTPEARRGLESGNNFMTAGFDSEALADYVSKNRAEHFELSDEMLKLSAPHKLVTDAEVEGMFAGDCEKGWEKFYRKYPGAQGNLQLSRVGFNKSRDAAVLYAGNQSHCLAGVGYYVFLKKDGGTWKVLKKSMAWIS